MFKKNKWMLLYLVLALVLFFSLFVVPGIVVNEMNGTKGQIITVPAEPPDS